MPKCTPDSFYFPSFSRRKIEAKFSGGKVTSDGGVLLLREMDRRMQLSKQLPDVIPDPRNPELITHPQLALLKQRIYALALGYDDLNDYTQLRKDPAFQTAVERDEVLASSSTLCRLENRSARRAAFDMHRLFVETFIDSFQAAPDELILDFDATDDRVYGEQEGRLSSGYPYQEQFMKIAAQLSAAQLSPG